MERLSEFFGLGRLKRGKMTKNALFFAFQCNQSLAWAKGVFWGVGYKSYTYLLNFPQWNFTILNFPLFYFTLCKVFVFCCNLCNFNCSTQCHTGLHWNFFLCNREAKNRRNPKPSKGYTEIEALCNLLLIKKQIKIY